MRPRIFEVHVPPGGDVLELELELAPWSGREILLRLGADNGGNHVEDYLYVQRPRIRRCSARRHIADALRAGVTEVHGGRARADGRDVILSGGETEISYRFFMQRGTCVAYGWRDDSPGDGSEVAYRVDVKVDGLRHRIGEGALGAAHPEETVENFSLHDWAMRWVEVVFGMTPAEHADHRTRLIAPRLYRCGDR